MWGAAVAILALSTHPVQPPQQHWFAGVASVYNQWEGPVACQRPADSMTVAHKTLPCGTKIRFSYGGREATATVEDRGPYIAGRDFDLSFEVMRDLNFPNGYDGLKWRILK